MAHRQSHQTCGACKMSKSGTWSLPTGYRKTVNDLAAWLPQIDKASIGDLVEWLIDVLDQREGDPDLEPDDEDEELEDDRPGNSGMNRREPISEPHYAFANRRYGRD
jgi:hypothetical protein